MSARRRSGRSAVPGPSSGGLSLTPYASACSLAGVTTLIGYTLAGQRFSVLLVYACVAVIAAVTYLKVEQPRPVRLVIAVVVVSLIFLGVRYTGYSLMAREYGLQADPSFGLKSVMAGLMIPVAIGSVCGEIVRRRLGHPVDPVSAVIMEANAPVAFGLGGLAAGTFIIFPLILVFGRSWAFPARPGLGHALAWLIAANGIGLALGVGVALLLKRSGPPKA